MQVLSDKFDWNHNYIVGVLNVTPDSFSDGGQFLNPEAAFLHGKQLAEDGADWIDVGGESTRPHATNVSQQEELDRVIPVIERLAQEGIASLSVDTTKSQVAQEAIKAGAVIVNDISGTLFDAAMVDVLRDSNILYICGHVRGHTIADVHRHESEALTVMDVIEDLGKRLMSLPVNVRQRTILDPCLGFGKTAQFNMELVQSIQHIKTSLSRPIMIGASRKRFVLGDDIDTQDNATVGISLAAIALGANVIRVHNVSKFKMALTMFERAYNNTLH